jgi:hypothetical protein
MCAQWEKLSLVNTSYDSRKGGPVGYAACLRWHNCVNHMSSPKIEGIIEVSAPIKYRTVTIATILNLLIYDLKYFSHFPFSIYFPSY